MGQQCDVYIHLSPRTNRGILVPEVILRKREQRSDIFGYSLNYTLDVNNRNGVVAATVFLTTNNRNACPLLKEFGRKRHDNIADRHCQLRFMDLGNQNSIGNGIDN